MTSAMGRARLGAYDEAHDYFPASLYLARQVIWSFMEAMAQVNLAAIAHLRGEHRVAAELGRAAADFAAANGARDLEAAACLPLGLAETALGKWDEARVALTRSRQLFELNEGPHLAVEPTAGLARLSLAEGDISGAVAAIDTILRHLADGGHLHATEEPFRIRWSCFEVLRHAGDPRADDVLAGAHANSKPRPSASSTTRPDADSFTSSPTTTQLSPSGLDGLRRTDRRGQKRQRVAPPGSTVPKAVELCAARRYTNHGGGPAVRVRCSRR
jgi:hypothetical protein